MVGCRVQRFGVTATHGTHFAAVLPWLACRLENSAMATMIRTNSGALALATREKAAMISSVVHLFKTDLNVSINTVAADLDAAEADFDGYEAITVAAMLAPVYDPLGGVGIETGTIQFVWAHDTDDVANMIYGFWHVTATGGLLSVGKFTDPIPMSMVGQGLPMSVKYLYPAN